MAYGKDQTEKASAISHKLLAISAVDSISHKRNLEVLNGSKRIKIQ